MSSPPRVTVTMCTRNRVALLPRAVTSVLRQTFDDLELVVVDDASDDGTPDYLAGVTDERVRVVRNARQLGLAASRNVALDAARGDLVAFLDDDDEYVPTKLAEQVAAMDAAPSDVGAIWCFQRWIHGDVGQPRHIVLRGDVRDRLAATDIVQMQSLLVRREAVERVGHFDPFLTHYDDFDWTLRLARSFRFDTVEAELVLMHETSGSLSKHARERVEMARHIIAKHPEIRGSHSLRSRWLVRAAESWAEAGDAAGWRRTMIEAWRADPLGVRAPALLVVGLVGGPSAPVAAKRSVNRRVRRLRAASARRRRGSPSVAADPGQTR